MGNQVLTLGEELYFAEIKKKKKCRKYSHEDWYVNQRRTRV